MLRRALKPAADLRDRLGLPERSRRLRRRAIEMHLARAGGRATSPADEEWVGLHHRISEAGGYFFSENLISNESEYLAPAAALEDLPRGLAYLGVGPEQTFSYLGLLGSPLAFVVDVRRDNARLHFLYRALFEVAGSRTEWLALLLGRPHDPAADPGSGASLDEVLASATSAPPSRESFRAAHVRLRARLDRLPGLLLPGDRGRVETIHRWFWRRQLDLTFQLGGPRLRRYPTLKSQLSVRAPDGRQLGFLASETSFRAVQELQRQARVLPVVGDLGGGAALEGVGAVLRERKLELGALYVSNVEQYLFERGTFPRWVQNLRILPCHPDAVILRSYPVAADARPAPDAPPTLLQQVRRSAAIAARVYFTPDGRQVHVMPTVVHRLTPFLERADRYRSLRELVCDPALAWAGGLAPGSVEPPSAGPPRRTGETR